MSTKLNVLALKMSHKMLERENPEICLYKTWSRHTFWIFTNTNTHPHTHIPYTLFSTCIQDASKLACHINSRKPEISFTVIDNRYTGGGIQICRRQPGRISHYCGHRETHQIKQHILFHFPGQPRLLLTGQDSPFLQVCLRLLETFPVDSTCGITGCKENPEIKNKSFFKNNNNNNAIFQH